MKTLFVNLFGGPSTGKSTTAALLFGYLKLRFVNCELVTEYAKDVVWRGAENILKNQLYVFAKQQSRMERLKGKVDVVITDSPLYLSLIYGENCHDEFKRMVKKEISLCNNFDVYLKRVRPYQIIGRLQTEAEAIAIDQKLYRMRGFDFQLDADEKAAEILGDMILARLKA